MKKTVDQVVLMLAIREFISSCDADVLARLTSDFFGVDCTPNPFVPDGYDIEPNGDYMGAFDEVFDDTEM